MTTLGKLFLLQTLLTVGSTNLQGNNRLKSCSWQAVINTTSGFSKLIENQFTSKSVPDTFNLTFNFKFADVPSNIVPFPGSEHYVWLFQDTLLITRKRNVVNVFKLYDDTSSSPLYCINPNDLYVDTPNEIVYISCSTGVLALSVLNKTYYMETVGEGSAHAFVVRDGYTYSIYVDDFNALWRFNLKNSDIVLIYADIITSVGHCSSKWQPLTFNTTYFFLKCKESKQTYLVREGQDKQLIPLNGDLWNLKDIVVDLTTSNFTFYKNGFQSKCSVSLPIPVSRVDSIDVDGKIILVLLTQSVIMAYNTSRGCNDQYLQVMANGTFPCFSGECDGYHLFGGQYILIVSLHSGTYHIGGIDLKSMSPVDYHFELVDSPQGLNAFCDPPVPPPTSLAGDTGSGSINNSTSQTSTQSSVPSPTSSVNINTTTPFYISTFSVVSSLDYSLHITPSTTNSPTISNTPFPFHIPASVATALLFLVIMIVIFSIVAVLICLRVKASKNKQLRLPIQEKGIELRERRGSVLNEICGDTDTTESSLSLQSSQYSSSVSLQSSQYNYFTNGLAQTDSSDGKLVPNLRQERLYITDPSTVLSDPLTQNPLSTT